VLTPATRSIGGMAGADREFPWIHVRAGTESDLQEIASMIDDFVKGHPAERHPRPIARLRAALFGTEPVAQVLVALRRNRIVGMVQWCRTYDCFWAMFGASVDWLYVRTEVRGLGVAAALVAEVCSRVRQAGGEFLRGGGTDEVSRLYERVAIGGPTRECHLSGEAFQVFADLAGTSPREVVRGLPSRELNKVAARNR
jgi:GNAT superfamily N-acetyltransferase